MPRLQIDLQDGFNGDSVSLSVNGAQVLNESGLSTRQQVGVARSVQTEVDTATAVVELRVMNRNIHQRTEIPMNVDQYVGLSVGPGNSVREVRRDRPFEYA